MHKKIAFVLLFTIMFGLVLTGCGTNSDEKYNQTNEYVEDNDDDIYGDDYIEDEDYMEDEEAGF